MKKKREYSSPTVISLSPDLAENISAEAQACSTGSSVKPSVMPLQCVIGSTAGGLCGDGSGAAVLCQMGGGGTAS